MHCLKQTTILFDLNPMYSKYCLYFQLLNTVSDFPFDAAMLVLVCHRHINDSDFGCFSNFIMRHFHFVKDFGRVMKPSLDKAIMM